MTPVAARFDSRPFVIASARLVFGTVVGAIVLSAVAAARLSGRRIGRGTCDQDASADHLSSLAEPVDRVASPRESAWPDPETLIVIVEDDEEV